MKKNIFIASNQPITDEIIWINYKFKGNYDEEGLLEKFEHFFYYNKFEKKLYYAKIAFVIEAMGEPDYMRESQNKNICLVQFKGIRLHFQFEEDIDEAPLEMLKDVYAQRNARMIGDRAFSIYKTSKLSEFSYALPIVDEATFMMTNQFREMLLYDNSIIPENEEERKTFAKIVNEDGELSLTLTNENMIKVDYEYILEEKHRETYRPYFYEFILSKEAQEKLKSEGYSEEKLYEVEIISVRGIKEEPKDLLDKGLYKGILLFSASPVKRVQSYIKILHTNPNSVVDNQFREIENFVSSQITTVTDKKDIEDLFMENISLSGNSKINYEIKVYNVGQGNWIHIQVYDDKDLKAQIIFDIGIGKHEDVVLRSNVTKNAAAEIKDNYMFILSHWDVDHIQGIVELQRNQFYKTWIIPNLPPKNVREGAKRLAAFLTIEPKIKAMFIDHALNGHLIFENKYFKLGKGLGDSPGNQVSYTQENNLGLILVIKTEDNKMLFPGDCEYIQFPDSFLNNQDYKALIVSHHGAKINQSDLTSLGLIKSGAKKFAAVCVGKDKSYPKSCHKSSIKDLGYAVKETRSCKNKIYESYKLK